MSFSAVYSIGDSLSDSGAFFTATSAVSGTGIPLELLGYAGRFSDGPVAAEVAAGLLGASIAPDLFALAPPNPLDDLDPGFAYGSARALGSRTVEEILLEGAATIPELGLLLGLLPPEVLAFDINLGAQTARLSATLQAAPPPEGALATIFIGLNDFGSFDPLSPLTAPFEGAALIANILEATETAARAAADGGVDTVALFTFPSLSFFPPVPGQPPLSGAELALADGLFALHELGLNAIAAELRAEGVDARVVDLGSMAAAVDADTAGFGIETLDVPVVLGAGGPDGVPNPAAFGLDPDALGFFDFLHFSAALHGVFGAFTARTLTADDTVFLGPLLPIRIFGGQEQLVIGGDEDAFLSLGGGGDAAFGGRGEDVILGRSGADLLAGGGDADALYGGGSDDLLAGGEAGDVLRGHRGDDVLLVGQGADDARGGRDDDLFVLDLAEGAAGAVLRGGRGVDTLVVLNAASVGGAALEAELIAAGVDAAGFEALTGVPGGALPAGGTEGALLREAAAWNLVDLEAAPLLV